MRWVPVKYRIEEIIFIAQQKLTWYSVPNKLANNIFRIYRTMGE